MLTHQMVSLQRGRTNDLAVYSCTIFVTYWKGGYVGQLFFFTLRNVYFEFWAAHYCYYLTSTDKHKKMRWAHFFLFFILSCMIVIYTFSFQIIGHTDSKKAKTFHLLSGFRFITTWIVQNFCIFQGLILLFNNYHAFGQFKMYPFVPLRPS